MIVLKIGISLILLTTASLAVLLCNDTVQLQEFLLLLIPAYCIVFISLACRIKTCLTKNQSISSHNRSRGRIRQIARCTGLCFLSFIFILNIACVASLYMFSRDRSFNDWRYGHFQADNPEELFALTDDGLRPITVPNVEAVKEARRILLPLKPYIKESSQAHDISPDAVATFILVNRMIREDYPTYDFHSALAHICWHMSIFPGQKAMDDTSPLYRSDWSKILMCILPSHTRLQDRATDFLGGIIMGCSATIGNMQCKASPVPGFEEEKSVRGNNLWQRMDIDLSHLSDRQINWMLLTNPKLDIEAGVAGLKQSVCELAELQKMGQLISSADLSTMDNQDWLHVFSEINPYRTRTPIVDDAPRHIVLHDLTNFFRLTPEDKNRLNYVEYYAIVIQSAVFEDTPGIIVDVSTDEHVEYLRTFRCSDNYLNDAARRSLGQ